MKFILFFFSMLSILNTGCSKTLKLVDVENNEINRFYQEKDIHREYLDRLKCGSDLFVPYFRFVPSNSTGEGHLELRGAIYSAVLDSRLVITKIKTGSGDIIFEGEIDIIAEKLDEKYNLYRGNVLMRNVVKINELVTEVGDPFDITIFFKNRDKCKSLNYKYSTSYRSIGVPLR